MDLKNKVAVITGGNSGIGRAIANVLAAGGTKVALLARREEKLKEVKGEIEKAGGTAMTIPTDVTKEEDVEQAMGKIADEWGGIDILVSNAGLGIFKRVEEMSVDEFDRHIDVMVKGAFVVTKQALPHLYARGAGHIIFISSLWAKRYCAKCTGYTAAKFGVRGLAQSLREEAREKNVKVTNVMPGTVATPFFDKADWDTDLSKAIQPDDVAATVLHALQLPDRAVINEVEIEAIRPPGGD
jgi:NADP-dependent 3-hydroxy acid dehydrogenase YdfG